MMTIFHPGHFAFNIKVVVAAHLPFIITAPLTEQDGAAAQGIGVASPCRSVCGGMGHEIN
ncbi:MAG: hypothetical protein LBS04_03635 [Tannerellaceae bacterium]|nr:hypothetical protein [Tannerellaceae bacterium]